MKISQLTSEQLGEKAAGTVTMTMRPGICSARSTSIIAPQPLPTHLGQVNLALDRVDLDLDGRDRGPDGELLGRRERDGGAVRGGGRGGDGVGEDAGCMAGPSESAPIR